jgi:hypothetical protein
MLVELLTAAQRVLSELRRQTLPLKKLFPLHEISCRSVWVCDVVRTGRFACGRLRNIRQGTGDPSRVFVLRLSKLRRRLLAALLNCPSIPHVPANLLLVAPAG